ncbi:hypothetical protein MPTK1_4g12260 [Marchantia polymorpha subsp. ruderalis]|uniref:Uncharacterized protein n=2 Tax=Marchantia polymorpha TaxID=3197 RepID=A0AAF6B939_MARPO|nr:hypothetical protein MARPO_0011s0208 [Marchantia polymorpha]BBN08523.1 hypothetical protein Mp_4g12260 [Marchantia polymorpha subsp. ruderalis]|eukprot:PTQ46557.1 hypothetical protein MARPO_0011s0208 [Marchantia polymorpha]
MFPWFGVSFGGGLSHRLVYITLPFLFDLYNRTILGGSSCDRPRLRIHGAEKLDRIDQRFLERASLPPGRGSSATAACREVMFSMASVGERVREVQDKDQRLFTGLRWHHQSRSRGSITAGSWDRSQRSGLCS